MRLSKAATIVGALCAAADASPLPSGAPLSPDYATSDHHAVLVCGSNGFGNYRHHADVCHAKQILIQGGVPAENIVTFLYDDVAQSEMNPFPGKLFNRPSNGTGVDVYEGCSPDYTGEDVNAENVLAVLKGDTSAVSGGNGKVLRSTSSSLVFVNFVDHGAPGLFGMPSGDELYADKLLEALHAMHDGDMYNELVIYLEACESGSMFKNLPSDMGIFATTAANDHESSWGCYCEGDSNMVDGKEIGSCLGDLYSVNWMQDIDADSSGEETLSAQYDKVKQETLHGDPGGSHVQEFGDVSSIASRKVSDFIPHKLSSDTVTPVGPGRTVDAREATLFAYQRSLRLAEPGSDAEARLKHAVAAELESRAYWDLVFRTLAKSVDSQHWTDLLNEPLPLSDYACLRQLNTALKSACGRRHTDYSYKYVQALVNLCEGGVGEEIAKRAITAACHNV